MRTTILIAFACICSDMPIYNQAYKPNPIKAQYQLVTDNIEINNIKIWCVNQDSIIEIRTRKLAQK